VQLRVLTDEDLQRIHDATLKVLETTGVWFRDCPQAHELFARAGCKTDDVRVRFPPGAVTDALARVPDRHSLSAFFPRLGYAEPLGVGPGETHFGLIGNAYHIYDYQARTRRDCVEADVADKLLILDRLPGFRYDCCNLFTASQRGIGGPVATTPHTPDAAALFLRRWVCARAVPERKVLPLGTRNCTEEESRLTVLAHAILEGPDATARLLTSGAAFPWVNPQSPLQYKATEANAIIDAARHPRDWNQVSPEVMMGGTGPVTVAGALVQHNAEVLAGLVLAQQAKPESPFIYGCVSAPMDLRNADISQGSFETALFNAAVVQIADRYGLPTRISPGNSSDPRPSGRALAETAVGLYMGAAAGGNIITTGLLDSTLTLSYEHLVMVDELIGQIRSVTGGISTDAESLALEAIASSGHPGGNYLASQHTLQYMKRDIHYSEFCGRIQDSYEDGYEKAHRRVDDMLAQGNTRSGVEKEVTDRLAAVQARLAEDDNVWRDGDGDWWRSYVQDLE